MVKNFFSIFRFDFKGYFTEFKLSSLVDLYKLQVLSRLPQFGDVHRRENESAQKSTDMFQSQGKDHQKALKC